jgi:FAD/FMN-containing dehydrogenase/Fe-S oxidoreductase
VDAARLERALRSAVRGDVRFDAGSRALYSTDSSHYRQVPIGVVLPRDKEDAVAALEVCRGHEAPVLMRGGGTSLAGQGCNVAVVLDFSRYVHDVVSIDPERRLAVVQPGTVLDDLRAAAFPHGLTFGPDPASHDRCTLGGMIGNDSCGVHSVMAAFEGEGARTADQVEELEIVTYEGTRLRVGRTRPDELARILGAGGRRAEIYRGLQDLAVRYGDRIRTGYPNIPRRVSGYNLPDLLPEKGFHVARALTGSEGTCVVVLEATLRLLLNPKARTLLLAAFPDVYAAADCVPDVLAHRPIGLEGIDDRLVRDMRSIGLHPRDLDLLPAGGGWLLIEFGGETPADSEAKASRAAAELKRLGSATTRICRDREEAARLWRIRESGLGATAHVTGKPLTWEGWDDSAVPPENLGHYLRELRALMDRHGYEGVFYGHFGQGCLHTRIDFDFETPAGRDRYRAFVFAAADLVVSFGGSLSGEHGDGQSRAELLPRMFGGELVEAFRQFKRIWDPQGRMNPGKVVDAYAMTDNLRLLGSTPTPVPPVDFHYREDGGSFSRAIQRCVGVAKCRRTSGGTMCPSYFVTREEEHSTRGRARLLFEMLRGDFVTGGWRSREVKNSLDLCLSCKGCKKDCPVNVDMATYKAEFLSHYYAGRLRPRSAYAFGLIAWWSRLASLAPGWANLATQGPAAPLARWAAGIDRHRRIPAFASETFRHWFHHRPESRIPKSESRERVILWPDTFSNHFHPGVAKTAVRVLEAAGFEIALPSRPLCCGRPLYDYGMLGLARSFLKRTVRELSRELRAGATVVVLEPSCASVFRDEAIELFPEDEDVRRLRAQTLLLSEVLARKAPGWAPGRLQGRALVQMHCHQKSVLDVDAENEILGRLGLEVREPNDSCCGMAGGFGFDQREVSRDIAERALCPAVREAALETLIIADGFSCREQIRQETGRRALHLAEVLHLAGRSGGRALEPFPEAAYPETPAGTPSRKTLALLAGGAALATVALWGVATEKRR